MTSRPPELHRRLGDALVAEGHLTPEQLAWALDVGERTGSRLGAIVVAAGLVRRLTLYQLLAKEWRIDFIDVAATDIDPSVSAGLDPAVLRRDGWLPIGERPDGTLLIATSERPDVAFYTMLVSTFHRPVRVMVTTDWDVLQGLRRVFGDRMLGEAPSGLWRREPALSARRLLSRGQRRGAWMLVAAAAIAVAVSPAVAAGVLLAIAGLLVGASGLGAMVVSAVGARSGRPAPITGDDLVARGDRALPVSTVLVPVPLAAAAPDGGRPDLAELVEHLDRLNYPADRLEVLLLFQPDDHAGIRAARRLAPSDRFTFVTVPRGGPDVRGTACNVGLFLARGEHVVVYDVGDRPDPDQLRKAAIALAAGGPELLAVQAALDCRAPGRVGRIRAAEQTRWFDTLLPGLVAARLPVPVGGSSTHFRTDELRRLGGWDPYNVTEGADLGLRAAAAGYRVGLIESTTSVAGTATVRDDLRRRTRELGGCLQTCLVHLRRPRHLRRIGRGPAPAPGAWDGSAVAVWPPAGAPLSRLLPALATGALPLAALLAPVVVLALALARLAPGLPLIGDLPGAAVVAASAGLVAGCAGSVGSSFAGRRRRRALAVPGGVNGVGGAAGARWSVTLGGGPLQIAAAYLGAWELLRRMPELHGPPAIDPVPAGRDPRSGDGRSGPRDPSGPGTGGRGRARQVAAQDGAPFGPAPLAS